MPDTHHTPIKPLWFLRNRNEIWAGARCIAVFPVDTDKPTQERLTEAEANARLFLASHKMLAALGIAIAIADSAQTAGRQLSDKGEFLAAARAAVAEATGEA